MAHRIADGMVISRFAYAAMEIYHRAALFPSEHSSDYVWVIKLFSFLVFYF